MREIRAKVGFSLADLNLGGMEEVREAEGSITCCRGSE